MLDRFQFTRCCFFSTCFRPHTETTIKLIEFRNKEHTKKATTATTTNSRINYAIVAKVLFPANQNKLQEIAIKLK